MKLNIFRIPPEGTAALRNKLNSVDLSLVHTASLNSWVTEFYFSREPIPVIIPWVEDFSLELASLEDVPTNSLHFGVFLWRSEEYCFALSFGKAHFYLREFCDGDFGLDMVRRIGDRDDVRQKAARRYAGRRKKEIRSYQRETQLDIESGESVDYLQASTIDADLWGATAKFGTSMLVNPSIGHDDLPDFLDKVVETLQQEPRFSLPRIEAVKNASEIDHYDQKLIEAILDETAEFGEEGPQLVGVDFVFSGQDKYTLSYNRLRSSIFDSLEMQALRSFIQENDIPRSQAFKIKVKVTREDSKEYSVELKKTLEYSIEKVFLQHGKWVSFNEDYAKALDAFIDDAIEIDETIESDLVTTSMAEPAFNEALPDRGYEYADKDFDIVKLPGYKIEAWDLKKGRTVYAVKFGIPQKISYVFDQASNVLEIFRNEPATFKNMEVDNYCVWLVLDRVNPITNLSEIKSIIFKQKLDAWARKCRELGIKPLVRLSLRPGP